MTNLAGVISNKLNICLVNDRVVVKQFERGRNMVKWVIIVDSDIIFLKTVGQILSKNNYRVTALKTGEALLNYLKENDIPDMILLDDNLKGLSSEETLKNIRLFEEQHDLPIVPVMFFTHDTSRDFEIKIGELGVEGTIKKPCDAEELLRKVKNVLFPDENKEEDSFMDRLQEDYSQEEIKPESIVSLNKYSGILRERSMSNHALLLDKEIFIHVYRFIMRYIKRYNKNACNLLFTVNNVSADDEWEYKELREEFKNHVINKLRKSDILTQPTDNQIMVLLTDIKEVFVEQVIGSIISSWYMKYQNKISISYEVHFESFSDSEGGKKDDLTVFVVDDDFMNLKMASFILEKNGIKVFTLKSGQELLDEIKNCTPDLILLDVNMPEMDGFEALQKLRSQEESSLEIPVIFLTAEDSNESETKGLSLGAHDFIKKPFVPDVLILRVRHTIELTRLQKNLELEVNKKSKEMELLFLHVVQSLADAIDAKDTYTNGHSARVAKYSKEIAKRFGYSESELDNIYIMALLHDVGKIGVPDAVINKPAKLTDEEFEMIKNHPVMGARILKNIKELPKLSIGARWHHERYDGKGYPDGLNGNDIPEEARIIAVADAYDAMTSRRSYRGTLTQEKVRSEIVNGIGTQFDPIFAKIMLSMIDEDNDYTMKDN